MPEQASRYESDAWEENIGEYLKKHDKVTVGQVAREALDIETPRIGTADQRRVAAALEQLGWRRLKPDSEGKRWWKMHDGHHDAPPRAHSTILLQRALQLEFHFVPPGKLRST